MFNLFTTAYAEAVATSAEATTGAAGTAQASGMFSIVWLVAMIVVFYFVLIRPQKKQERAHEALVSSVEAGDSVLTSSGFYGVVIDVMDEVVIVEFGNNKNCRIPMQKQAIVQVEKANSEE